MFTVDGTLNLQVTYDRFIFYCVHFSLSIVNLSKAIMRDILISVQIAACDLAVVATFMIN